MSLLGRLLRRPAPISQPAKPLRNDGYGCCYRCGESYGKDGKAWEPPVDDKRGPILVQEKGA